jgi:hypothetical protein
MGQMTKTYLVTGAGCRRREETLVVPEGVQIIFYQMRPRPPRVTGVRTPLDELMVATRLLSARATGPGETIQSAFCWERSAEAPPSGVHRRGTGALVMDLSDTSMRRPVSLGHIVRELAAHRQGRPTVIHWLVQPADAAPARPDWQLQRPPRLFQGDGSESGHTPLDELAGMQVSEIPWSEEMDEAAPPGWVTV